jgi:hypothetical protein
MAYGYFEVPQYNELFQIPPMQINVQIDGKTKEHGFMIYNGQPNQVIPLVDFLIWLKMDGEEKAQQPAAPFNQTLNAAGEYIFETSLEKSIVRTQGDYTAQLYSSVTVNGVLKDEYDHSHPFRVRF